MRPVAGTDVLDKLCECGCGDLAPVSTYSRASEGRVKGLPIRFIDGHNTRLRISELVASQGPRVAGEDHPNWSGDEPSLAALHKRIRKEKIKTGVCSECRQEAPTQWANVSGTYQTDADDFAELCICCHQTLDRIAKFVGHPCAWLILRELIQAHAEWESRQ